MSVSLSRFFKIGRPGDPGKVSCGTGGASVGPVSLLERTSRGLWQPRSVNILNSDLSRHYGFPVDMSLKIDGIATVANALNEGNIVKATIAAVHLRLPDLPSWFSEAQETGPAADLLCRLFESGILSKTWDPEKHPRWPAGQTDGGRFRANDGERGDQDNDGLANEEIAADPAKFTECNERCSKLLERYRTYKYSNVNEFHYRQCMNECLGVG
jgi:hypothetical protein